MFIYLVTNTINNRAYVGQTARTVYERWTEHVDASKHASDLLLHSAIRKYGQKKFTIQILSTHASSAELNEAEKAAIIAHKTHVKQGGYNLTEGGQSVNFSSWKQAEARYERAQERDYLEHEPTKRKNYDLVGGVDGPVRQIEVPW